MLQPDAVPCSSLSSSLPTTQGGHDDYVTEAVALAERINRRLAERTRSLAQELVDVPSAPQPLVGPTA
jgi:hypothetical protein